MNPDHLPAVEAVLAMPEFAGVDPAAMRAIWPAVLTAARILAAAYAKAPPVPPAIVNPDLSEEPFAA